MTLSHFRPPIDSPASVALLPRLIASLKLADAMKLHGDIGYEYDFETPEPRQFTWKVGGSLASERTALDVGFGGSEFDAPVQWTPTLVHWGMSTTNTGTTLEDHTVGTSVIDVLVGLKLRLTAGLVLAGGVSVPVVTPAFQPDALGTVAVEVAF